MLPSRNFIFSILILAPLLPAMGVVLVDTSTNDATDPWAPISYLGPTDPYTDRQSQGNEENEIVGDTTNGLDSFYVNFDGGDDTSSTDGTIFFRIRVSGNKGKADYDGYSYVGLDVTGDGALDFFLGVNSKDSLLTLQDAGNDLNNSPNTSSISSTNTESTAFTASNFDWSPVSDIDSGVNSNIDGANGEDYFISFAVDFAWVVNAAVAEGVTDFDENSGIAYVTATSQNPNNLNADLNGVDNDNFNANDTWTTLGAINNPVTADGTPVPEPASFAFLSGCMVTFLALFRRRRHSCSRI